MSAAQTAVAPAEVSTKPELRHIMQAAKNGLRRFFDQIVTGSAYNLNRPARELPPEFFKYPF